MTLKNMNQQNYLSIRRSIIFHRLSRATIKMAEFCSYRDHRTDTRVFGFDKTLSKEYMYKNSFIKAIDSAPLIPTGLEVDSRLVQDKLFYVRRTLSPYVCIAGGMCSSSIGVRKDYNDIDIFCGIYRESPRDFDMWIEFFIERYKLDMNEHISLELGTYMNCSTDNCHKDFCYQRWVKRGQRPYFKVATILENPNLPIQLIFWYLNDGKREWEDYTRRIGDPDEIGARYCHFVHTVLSGFDITACRVAFLIDPRQTPTREQKQRFSLLRLCYIPPRPTTYMNNYAFIPCAQQVKRYEKALKYLKQRPVTRAWIKCHSCGKKQIAARNKNTLYCTMRMMSMMRSLSRYVKYTKALRRQEIGMKPFDTKFILQPKSLIECALSALIFYQHPPPFNSQRKLMQTQEYMSHLGCEHPLPPCRKFGGCTFEMSYDINYFNTTHGSPLMDGPLFDF